MKANRRPIVPNQSKGRDVRKVSSLHRRSLLAGLVALALVSVSKADEKAEQGFFESQVLPLLQKRCYECHSHGKEKIKGGLALDSQSGWRIGGDSGPAIVPGKPDESLLIKAIRYSDLEMPPNGKLAADEIAIFEKWVSEGAFDNRTTESILPKGQINFEKGAKHWAFQPIRRDLMLPEIEQRDWVRSPIDFFVLHQLEQQKLRPNPDADPNTWLRRVTLDLTGVPPSVEELAAFAADSSDTARERVVDRLLKSPRFGEKWARHWLDLVGYADQIGTANDVFAEHAWRYRDYVIQAINEDKSYDDFVREQIAGDLLETTNPKLRAAQITATGFLLLGDLTIVEADKAKLRIDTIDQQLDKAGRAFLGMTLGCARCHDHKFDPISQHDYYALAGFFYNTESLRRAEWGIWSFPTEVELPETEEEQTKRLLQTAEAEQKLAALRAERDKLNGMKQEVDALLGDKDKPIADERIKASLTKQQQDLNERLQRLNGEIVHAEFFFPKSPRAFAVRDTSTAEEMAITIRGNAHALGDRVPRGYLTVLNPQEKKDSTIPGSGRIELANWIANEKNPLTARVAVNRIWEKLFGTGIVSSVDYFGIPADPPSNPELLDHLSDRFISLGWSQKKLIREIVLSRAYGISSEDHPENQKVDSTNRYFWRANRRRLDAEAIRDSMLFASGRMIDTNGGPGLPLHLRENTGGLGKGEVNPPHFRLARFAPEQEYVRTIYLPIIRSAPQSGPAELRNVFDFTQPAEFSGKRNVTSVPTQALFLLNSDMMKTRGRDLAQLILNRESSDEKRLRQVWLRLYSRDPSPKEIEQANLFLQESKEEYKPSGESEAEVLAWSELCQSLLATNEFMTKL